jgi:hypothetical protein
MSPTLGDALHELAGDVGDLGDIDRALRDVRNRRIRIAAGALAATCLAVLLVVLALPTPASIEPAGPEPTPEPAPAPARVIRPESVPGIADAPLANGADGSAFWNGRVVLWSGEQRRQIVNDTPIMWSSLSPNGRLHAVSLGGQIVPFDDSSEWRPDAVLVVTDLTTGQELLRWPMRLDGDSVVANRWVWSGDSQRLFVVLNHNPGTGWGTVHAWQRSGDTFRAVGEPRALPGLLIGANHDGTRVLSESGRALTQLDVETGRWSDMPGMVYDAPSGALGGVLLGQGCWDPELNRVCWVGPPEPGPARVGWKDLSTGLWTWAPPLPTPRTWLYFLGWQAGDAVVLAMPESEAEQSISRHQAVQLSPTGAVVLESIDTAQGIDALPWRPFVSLPAVSGWIHP